MPLTDRTIMHLKPDIKAYKLSDAHGLYLVINPSGSKLWYLKYRFAGKEKKLSFGAYPAVTLADARRLREEAKALLASGADPGEKRKQEKLNPVPEHTFQSVAVEWIASKASNSIWSAEHALRVKRYFELYVFPVIGAYDIEKLKLPNLVAPIKAVERAGKTDVARRLQQRTAAVMRYAAQNGIIEYNPAQDLTGAVAPTETHHHPALDLEQIPEFLRRIDHYKGREQTRLALQLTLLIFIRSSELRFARWEEIDLKRAIWTIPARREPIAGVKFSERGAKMRSPHLVPLSRQAALLLQRIQQLQGEKQCLIFPGARNLKKTMSEGTINKALRVMGYDTKVDVCGHGFRTMACSALVESGQWSSEAVERQMSHQERKKVRAAYIHKAKHIHERRKMMQWWADYLDANRLGWVSPYEFPWKG